jgi:hypothetical protein
MLLVGLRFRDQMVLVGSATHATGPTRGAVAPSRWLFGESP